MTCSVCGHRNREAAKFCEECAAPLRHLCPSCGAELRPTAKFCDECGARTAAAVPAASSGGEARKVVTIVFADLVGSTAMHERLDPESARVFMEGYYAAMRGAVEAHGGVVTQLLGDGVKAVFGVPRVAEDDAIRAVRAAVAMQEAFHALVERQGRLVGKTGLRVAVNSGEVVAKDTREIIGDPVNVAARLQEQGRDGDVVVGAATQRLVAALVTLELLGSFALKGRAEAVKAYRVVSLERPAGTTAAFVGRDEELARLTAVYEGAVAAPASRLAVVLGSPGFGKSRLIGELGRRLGDAATVLTAQCDAAGGATFAPVAEALREWLRNDGTGAPRASPLRESALGTDADRARIAAGIDALLAGSPASPEEIFFVVRRFLAAVAATQPVVLVIDDLQWAEPLLLDLVEHLVQWGGGVPLVVLVGARPELRETRSSLTTTGGLVADVVTLGGLDAAAAMRLAANVIGATDLPAAVAGKVLAASEGNPLFVGELVRMLVREGALTKEGERWTAGAGLAALEMPPTIHALLAARIERLRPGERSVLERAAVVGRHFSRSAVAALMPDEAADLDARLEALRRSELIERDTGWLLGEPALRFHHVLIRDAAYRRLLKGTRAELHVRLADWIEGRVGNAPEHDETIGWHLEQAHQHLRELGPLDGAAMALGERAARRLAAAGRRALARDDVALAAGLCGRALDRLTAEAPERADLVLDWCEALLLAGAVGSAVAAVAELDRVAADSARLRAWHTCFAGQLTVLTAPEALHATSERVGAAARELAALGDAAGEAKAYFVHAQALARLGKVGASEAALDQALAAARRAGDRRRANAVLAGAPLAALWGPSPVTRASGRCLDVVRVLRITQGAPAVEAVALSCQGVLEALRGRTAAARRMIASARKMVEELGISHRLFEADVFAARVDLLEGDAAAAERSLRGAYEGLRDLGLGIDAAQTAALLARALLAQGRAVEAEALSHESETLAGDDLQAAIAWRGVRAEALARRGEHVVAVELAEAAVAIAAATDALLDHADARLALAAALRAAGRGREADAEERRATELWEAKGATLLAERARRDAGGAAPVVPACKEPAEPVARFETLTVPARAVTRRVRPNAATESGERFAAAIASRDLEAFARQLSDDFELVHHPTGATYGRRGMVATWRSLFGAKHLTRRQEVLATLGDALVLLRHALSFEGLPEEYVASFGSIEMEEVVVSELDEHGRFRRMELFAPDHLGDACACLYERYAALLPDGPARDRAAATARSVAVMTTVAATADIERLPLALSPAIELHDRRRIVEGDPGGSDHWTHGARAYVDLAKEIVFRYDDLLRVEPTALLLQATYSGLDRRSDGVFEIPVLVLWVFGPDGLMIRWEGFDLDREAEALARYDALVAPSEAPFANAAVGAMRAFERCWRARDWHGVRATYHPTHRMDDRRRLMRVEVAGEDFFANERMLFDDTASEWRGELLATRGERLALFRVRFTATVGGSGPMEVEVLDVVEVDAGGFRTALVVVDPDDLDAAYVELDARWRAGEGAAHPRVAAYQAAFERGLARRDWDALAVLYAPTLVARDHRLVGWDTLSGPDAFVGALRAMVDLAPDALGRADHVRTSERGLLAEVVWEGTRDGGAFESPFVQVVELGGTGQAERLDFYDPHRLDQALVRFQEIAGSTPRDALGAIAKPTAASAFAERWETAFNARDWEALRAGYAPDVRWEDRRRLFQLAGDRDLIIASMRERAEAGARVERRVMGTAGDRVLVQRVLWSGGPAEGRFEIEFLAVIEVDETERATVVIVFDPDDTRAAQREAWARWSAIEPAAAPWVALVGAVLDGYDARDRERVRAIFADDAVVEDHRRTGFGRIEGADAYLERVRVLWDLAPEQRIELGWFWPAVERHGVVTTLRRFGALAGGGAFESDYLWLAVATGGRITRAEMFEIEDRDRALARLAALRPDQP